jgi:hypothetical protein
MQVVAVAEKTTEVLVGLVVLVVLVVAVMVVKVVRHQLFLQLTEQSI